MLFALFALAMCFAMLIATAIGLYLEASDRPGKQPTRPIGPTGRWRPNVSAKRTGFSVPF